MTIKKIKAVSITKISPEQACEINGGTGTMSWWGDCTSCIGTCYSNCCDTSTQPPRCKTIVKN